MSVKFRKRSVKHPYQRCIIEGSEHLAVETDLGYLIVSTGVGVDQRRYLSVEFMNDPSLSDYEISHPIPQQAIVRVREKKKKAKL